MKSIDSYIPAAVPGGASQKIPRIIHQTFKGAIVADGMWAAANSWQTNNPDHEYRFSEDEACEAFIAASFGNDVLSAYRLLAQGAFRADLWRYCALYVHGGVYADIDTECRLSLRRVIAPDDEFIVPQGQGRNLSLFNAFICATPRNPIIARVIEAALPLLKLGTHPFAVVGPTGLALALNHVCGRVAYFPFGQAGTIATA